MPITCAVLMCHAPIVVPEVAGDRAPECSRTTLAMSQVAQRLCAHRPDVLVIISPHATRQRGHWSVATRATQQGSFRRFGAARVKVELPGAPRAAALVIEAARALSLQVAELAQEELDHGALVPLHFVKQAGFAGPTLLIAPPASRTHSHELMGRAIAQAAADAGERWAVLASGDMSHRLTVDAPCGYHPRAEQFDRRFRDRIAQGALREACAPEPALRGVAAEDVVDSVAVAAAAVDYRSDGHQTYGYEGPFGVGYLEAVLFDELRPAQSAAGDGQQHARDAAQEPPWEQLLQVARQAIARDLGETPNPSSPVVSLPEPWNAPCGVFVTLRDRGGALRGCVGHLEPCRATLGEEIAACAVAAANRDTRFRPLRADELPGLWIELSLLSVPEPVSDLSTLDPTRFGVVVSCGQARGVLLPNVAGVTTAQQQLRIAANKGGLPDDRPWTIQRFAVRKGAETPPLTTARRGHA